ncbi:MAG: hypothetical protein IJC89_01515 [Clostridia bacterium]|nr:hypothetical protein [Clostridia bacterium]
MKNKISSLFLVVTLLCVFCISASAEETTTAAGFYDIGSKANIVITPTASDGKLQKVQADVDNDNLDETFYAYSDKMAVTYSAATPDTYYGIILVEGSTLPTKNSKIYYINQEIAKSNEVSFDVYPDLPKKNTDLTLYISSSKTDEQLIEIPLSYTVAGTFKAYTLGDVTGDDSINASDALRTLRIAAKLYEPTDAEKAAADVNGDSIINASDALRILRYAAKLITSWD